jgi:hypothetical protein
MQGVETKAYAHEAGYDAYMTGAVCQGGTAGSSHPFDPLPVIVLATVVHTHVDRIDAYVCKLC